MLTERPCIEGRQNTMSQPTWGRLETALYGPNRAADPLHALRRASTRLGLELDTKKVRELNEHEAARVIEYLETNYPER